MPPPPPSTVEFTGFKGLDVRRVPDASDPLSWRYAKNVHLTTGRGAESRDQLRLYARVDPRSLSLYVVNDSLRCALPYPEVGVETVPRPPVDLTYDLLVDQDAVGMTFEVEAITSIAAWDNRPYLCARVAVPGGTKHRHYFIPDRQPAFAGFATNQVGDTVTVAGLPAGIEDGATVFLFGLFAPYRVTARVGDDITLTPALPVLPASKAITVWWPVKNYVKVPFEPGPAVLTAADKVWAPDTLGRNVWYSSTEFGPTNWEALDDAGFISTSTNVEGDQPTRGLGVYRSKLVVFYETVAQIWTIDPDPANITFDENVGGAGTLYPESVENVSGDLFYFSNGAFRSLDAQVLTGQAKENDLGSAIRPLTQAVTPNVVSAVWSAWRQQYLCVFDQQVFVFTSSPITQTYGWGRWELPWPVEAIVEWRQRLYVRRADAPEVWVFDPEYEDEETYEWDLWFNFTDFGMSARFKLAKWLHVHQTGEADFAVGVNAYDDTDVQPVLTIDPATASWGRIPIMAAGTELQTRWSGTGYWKLDHFTITVERGELV